MIQWGQSGNLDIWVRILLLVQEMGSNSQSPLRIIIIVMILEIMDLIRILLWFQTFNLQLNDLFISIP